MFKENSSDNFELKTNLIFCLFYIKYKSSAFINTQNNLLLFELD